MRSIAFWIAGVALLVGPPLGHSYEELEEVRTWTPSQVQVGDLLLQPLDCWACELIEAEEESPFSHMGIVLAVEPEVRVAEAFGRVRELSLAEFLSKTERGEPVPVLRLRDSEKVRELQARADEWSALFRSKYEGASYDSAFLWDNRDESGREKYYCSELVSKMLQETIEFQGLLKPMHFTKNRESWKAFFRGRIPDGEPGNSPADFAASSEFQEVGRFVPRSR